MKTKILFSQNMAYFQDNGVVVVVVIFLLSVVWMLIKLGSSQNFKYLLC